MEGLEQLLGLWELWPWKHFASHVAKSEFYLLDKPTRGSRCAQGAATVCAHHPEGPRPCSALDWKCQGVKLAPKLCPYPNCAWEKGPDMILTWSRSQPCPGPHPLVQIKGVRPTPGTLWLLFRCHPMPALPSTFPGIRTKERGSAPLAAPMGRSQSDRSIFGPSAG